MAESIENLFLIVNELNSTAGRGFLKINESLQEDKSRIEFVTRKVDDLILAVNTLSITTKSITQDGPTGVIQRLSQLELNTRLLEQKYADYTSSRNEEREENKKLIAKIWWGILATFISILGFIAVFVFQKVVH